MLSKGIKQILFFMVGPFISRIFTFISLPIFSYFLTLKEFGTYNLFAILLMYFTPMITLGTEQFYLRNYTKKTGYQTRRAIFGMYIILFLITFFSCYLYYIFSGNNVINGMPFYYLLIAVTISLFNALQDIYIRTIRFHGLGESYSKLLFINQFFLFALSTILIAIYQNVLSLLLATLISSMFNYFHSILIFNKKIKNIEQKVQRISLQLVKKTLTQALKFSLPLLPAIFLWVFQSTVDRFFIVKYLNNEALGVFSIGFKFASIISMFVTSFLIFWEPKLYIAYDDHGDSKAFKAVVEKYKNFYGLFINTVILGMFIFLPFAIKVMSPEYQVALYIIPLMLFSNYIHGYSYFSGMGPQLRKKTVVSLIPLLVASLINIVLNALLIEKLNLLGVLTATNISFFSLLIINYVITKRMVKMVPSIVGDCGLILLFIGITTYFFVTKDYIISSIAMFLVYCIDLIRNKNKLKEYFNITIRLVSKKIRKTDNKKII